MNDEEHDDGFLMIAGLGYSQIPLMFGVEAHNPNYDMTPGIGVNLGTFYKLAIKDSLNIYGNAITDLSFYNTEEEKNSNTPKIYNSDVTGRCHGPDGKFVKSELCEEDNNNPKISPAINLEVLLNFNEFMIGGGARINSEFMPYVKVGITPPELKYFDFYLKDSKGYVGAGVMVTNKFLLH